MNFEVMLHTTWGNR